MSVNRMRLEEASAGPYRVASLKLTETTDPLTGAVVWDAARSVWNAGMLLERGMRGPFESSTRGRCIRSPAG